MRSHDATLAPDPEMLKALAYLYSRRSTLDTLIRSLEEYERFTQPILNGQPSEP
jgi:hypothetical protein